MKRQLRFVFVKKSTDLLSETVLNACVESWPKVQKSQVVKMNSNNLPTAYFDFTFFPVDTTLPEVVGEGAARLLILHRSAKEEALDLLRNILNAIGLDMNAQAYRIEVTEGQPLKFALLQKKWAVDKVLVFGLKPQDLALHLRWNKYQLYDFAHCRFIFADTLEALQAKVPLKKKLWAVLQTWKKA